MAYALGKYSYGVCDRCGFRVRYLQMRMEWTGFKVCPEWYDPKHPQLAPTHHPTDPEALRQPRPEVDLPRSQLGLVTTSGATNTTDSGVNVGGMVSTLVDPIGSSFPGQVGTGSIGTVTVVIS